MSKQKKLLKTTLMTVPFFGITSFALTPILRANDAANYLLTKTKFIKDQTISIADSLTEPITAEELFNARGNPPLDVRKFISSKCLVSLPTNFNESNVLKLNISDWNSLTGEVLVTGIQVNSFLDNVGNTIKQPIWINGTLTITGFKTIQPTTVVHSFRAPEEYKNTSPSSVDTTQLKKIIDDNISSIILNYPGTLDGNSYNLSVTDSSETSGCIYVNLKLHQIISPANGAISIENTDRILILYGFKQTYSGTAVVQPTVDYPDSSTILAQDLAESINKGETGPTDKLKTFIKNHVLHDAPSTFTESNITSIHAKQYNNLTGELIIDNIQVNSWKNTNGVPQSGANHTLDGSFLLNGFKIVVPTKILDTINAGYGFEGRPLSRITDNEIVTWMRNNTSAYIKNAPSDEIDKNQVSIKVESRSESEGTVNVKVTLPETYNSKGVKGNGGANLISKTVKLIGFQENVLKTYIINPSSPVPPPLDTYTPGEVNNNFPEINTLKKFIYDNMIMNKPTDSTYNMIESIQIENNPSGSDYDPTTLVINSITLNHWLDKDGNEHRGKNPISGPFILNGFKKASATTVHSTLDVSTIFSGLNAFQVPQERFLAWLSKGENWKQIIDNAPPGFKVTLNPKTTNLKISSYQIESTANIIKVTVSLSRYYTSNGELINNGNDEHEIQLINFAETRDATYIVSPEDGQDIVGFKKITPDIAFNKDLVIANLISMTDYNNNLKILKQFICDNLIKNKPDINGRPFLSSDIEDVEISKRNNKDGYIEISSVTLANSLDSSGNPTNKRHKIDYSFKVYGFKAISGPTSISDFVNVDESSNLFKTDLSDIDENTVKNYILSQMQSNSDDGNQVISNLPSIIDENNFNDNVIISVTRDMKRMELRANITLNVYYNDNYEEGYPLVKRSATIIPIRQTCVIGGFPVVSESWIETHKALFISLIVIGSLLLIALIVVPIVLGAKKKKENKIIYNQLTRISDENLLGNTNFDETLGIGGLNINRTIGNNLGVEVDSLSDILDAQVAQNGKLTKHTKKQLKKRKKLLKQRAKIQKKYFNEVEKQRVRDNNYEQQVKREKEKYKQQYIREGQEYFQTMQEQKRQAGIKSQAAYEAELELRKKYGISKPQNNGPVPAQGNRPMQQPNNNRPGQPPKPPIRH